MERGLEDIPNLLILVWRFGAIPSGFFFNFEGWLLFGFTFEFPYLQFFLCSSVADFCFAFCKSYDRMAVFFFFVFFSSFFFSFCCSMWVFWFLFFFFGSFLFKSHLRVFSSAYVRTSI